MYIQHRSTKRPRNDRRHAQLREANEALTLAALNAQELHAASQEAHRKQTDFLAVLAHELRNPLAPIRVATALLGRIRTDDPMLSKVQTIIERQVVHMSRLVADLLDVSRVNTGKLRLERRVVAMEGIIDAAVDACRLVMDTRRQRLDVHVPPGPLCVDGDPVRLAQIVGNLLDNASKYTPDEGTIGLSVELLADTLVLTVSDSGIGIPAEVLPRIFEPFVQDSNAIGFNGIGLGIGLTVVRELVQAHGGKVVASSAGEGLGSKFEVTLALNRRCAAASPRPARRT